MEHTGIEGLIWSGQHLNGLYLVNVTKCQRDKPEVSNLQPMPEAVDVNVSSVFDNEGVNKPRGKLAMFLPVNLYQHVGLTPVQAQRSGLAPL